MRLRNRLNISLATAALVLASLGNTLAAVLYVDINSTNATPPYINWATAATNIQDAVDAAAAGDEVVVTNGTYATGGRSGNLVEVDKPLNLRTVNGPRFTIIAGGGANRCAYLTNSASLSGFTLTQGQACFGGGVFCASPNEVVSNCWITGNYASGGRGCSYEAFGGGVYGGTLNNCALTLNSASSADTAYGGGVYLCTLNNCTLANNAVYGGYNAYGGGAAECTLNNCLVTGNSLTGGGSSIPSYAWGGGAYACTLNNCTAVGNSVSNYRYGGVGGILGGTLNNCISFRNTNEVVCEDCGLDPRFVNLATGNLRLQSNSPCINAGNNAFVPAGPDLDGNPRIAGGTVDIGAYEYQSPTSVISYAWLQQYSLPTDGSADFTDPDGDGMNNWQEWRCGTDPTNALSALRLLPPIPTGTNVTVAWQSVAGVSYFLQRSTNLTASPAFVTLATGIEGQAGTTTFVDSNAGGAGPFFYRVGVGAL